MSKQGQITLDIQITWSSALLSLGNFVFDHGLLGDICSNQLALFTNTFTSIKYSSGIIDDIAESWSPCPMLCGVNGCINLSVRR